MKERDYRASMLLECLGEPTRFQILMRLEDGPRSVNELARLTKRSLPTVSHHLALLRTMHLVRYRNQGTSTYYELKVPGVMGLLRAAIALAPKLSLPSPEADRR